MGAQRHARHRRPGQGHGTFAVLQLPWRYPRLGVRRKLNPDPLQPGRDEFSCQYWTICVDAEMAVNLISDAIKQAHVAGSLPDWMLVGDQVYIVTRHSGPTTPSHTRRAIQHVQRIADLLGSPATDQPRASTRPRQTSGGTRVSRHPMMFFVKQQFVDLAGLVSRPCPRRTS
jgi:hypothetical protein